jgi:SnoaL-like polyketide cyclase
MPGVRPISGKCDVPPYVEVTRRHISGDAVILEATLTGEHANTWQGIPPTGRRFEVPLCAVFPFDDDGQLTGERVYLDGRCC